MVKDTSRIRGPKDISHVEQVTTISEGISKPMLWRHGSLIVFKSREERLALACLHGSGVRIGRLLAEPID